MTHVTLTSLSGYAHNKTMHTKVTQFLLEEPEHVISLSKAERNTLKRASEIFADIRRRARDIDDLFEFADLDTDLALGEHICSEWADAHGGMTVEAQR